MFAFSYFDHYWLSSESVANNVKKSFAYLFENMLSNELIYLKYFFKKLARPPENGQQWAKHVKVPYKGISHILKLMDLRVFGFCDTSTELDMSANLYVYYCGFCHV